MIGDHNHPEYADEGHRHYREENKIDDLGRTTKDLEQSVKDLELQVRNLEATVKAEFTKWAKLRDLSGDKGTILE